MRHHRHLDLAVLALADQAADRRLAQQDLHERHAAAPARGQELLREDGAEDIGDLCAHDALLLLWVEALDAPHGLRRAARVQRAEHEHARLRGHERRRHRLAVAYLADEQDVRHLAQRTPERLREREEIAPELALADKASGWREDVLDGVLKRQDVRRPALVDRLQESGQRRRLARARAPRHEHEALPRRQQPLQGSRRMDGRKARDALRQHAHDERQARLLAVEIAAQPPPRVRQREVDGMAMAQLCQLPGRQECLCQRFHKIILHRFARLRQPLQPAVDAQPDRLPRRQVDVAGARLDSLHQDGRPERMPRFSHRAPS